MCCTELIQYDPITFNSLWPNDAIWRQRSGSTLAQVIACCLTAPSHYPNQCWLIIREFQWNSPEGNFMRLSEIPLLSIKKIWLKITISKISFNFPRGQWVKIWLVLSPCRTPNGSPVTLRARSSSEPRQRSPSWHPPSGEGRRLKRASSKVSPAEDGTSVTQALSACRKALQEAETREKEAVAAKDDLQTQVRAGTTAEWLLICFYSWPSDAIWWHKPGSTMPQEMVGTIKALV